MPETLPARTSRPNQSMFGLAPFRAFREEMDDVMSRLFHDWKGEWFANDFNPAYDVSETPDSLQIRMDVPGMKPEEISIEVSGQNLRVSGERKSEKEEKKETYHRVERSVGKFLQSIVLPCTVKDDKVEAEFENGVLTVKLPKTEAAKTHKVKVKSIENGHEG